MKRRNVQAAFVGEGLGAGGDEVDSMVEGDEAVDIEVTGGKLMAVVPAGTPDDQIFDSATTVGGELILENGVRLSFEINTEATGAQFLATTTDDADTHPGLSSLPDVPGGA
ncbi:MAG: hypothetical protein H0V51_18275 [Chloroflexi bacterium]|nr:hypothetical protein [Chloroflexota bacterium]